MKRLVTVTRTEVYRVDTADSDDEAAVIAIDRWHLEDCDPTAIVEPYETEHIDPPLPPSAMN